MSLEKRLLWSQEFRGQSVTSLDASLWNFDIGDGSSVGLTGWGNNEREYYTEAALTIDDCLKITAERVGPEANLATYYGPAEWVSSKIHTANKVCFKYGYLEIRAQAPKGLGTWPALWLLGKNLLSGTSWPDCGEIDLLEAAGNRPQEIQGTIHGPGYFGEHGLTKIIEFSQELSEDFHTYAINWSENRIEWLFDGVTYNVITRDDERLVGKDWPFNQEFYLIINLAMGGWYGGEIDPELREAELSVDWIRYYQIGGIGEVSFT